MLFRFALAAFVGLSACSDDGSKDPLSNGAGGGPPALRQSVTLSGPYATGIRIVGDTWRATAPDQEITIAFELSGIDPRQLRQFEIVVQADPADAFNLSSANFKAPDPPFLVPPFLPQGIQREGDGGLHAAWVILGEPQRPLETTEPVGTLTLRTSSRFNSFTRARLIVTELSLGPSSSQRDEYGREALNLGVDVN